MLFAIDFSISLSVIEFVSKAHNRVRLPSDMITILDVLDVRELQITAAKYYFSSITIFGSISYHPLCVVL